VGPDVDIDGASIDSRTIGAGELFVPIVAERDGHDFIEAALTGGARVYFTERDPEGGSAIVVPDSNLALTRLASSARDRLTGQVVGVTGSVGKTSVKDLIAAAVGPARRVHANPASFNNELGLPLTLVNAPDDTEVAVLEMGARGPGHVAHLCSIARPTIGVVTRVAGAHTELFGSLENVAKAKAELVDALPADGYAVLNADDVRVAAMAARTEARVITFGLGGDIRPVGIELDESLRPSFDLDTPSGRIHIDLQLAGAHMAVNAAAAVAVGLAAGVELESLVDGLDSATPSRWRMEVETAPSGLLVINDSYNANPTSVRAALAAMATLDRPQRIAVLGVMAELGPEHAAEHRAIADEANELAVRVIAVAAPEYGPDVEHVADVESAAEALGELGGDAAVLVKGSRVAGLERLAAVLAAR